MLEKKYMRIFISMQLQVITLQYILPSWLQLKNVSELTKKHVLPLLTRHCYGKLVIGLPPFQQHRREARRFPTLNVIQWCCRDDYGWKWFKGAVLRDFWESSVDKILSGHNYARSVCAHNLAYGALGGLIIELLGMKEENYFALNTVIDSEDLSLHATKIKVSKVLKFCMYATYFACFPLLIFL